MLYTEQLADGIILAKPTGKLKESDFAQLASKVDQMFKAAAPVRILVDATAFEGWEDRQAAASHFRFVRTHQQKVARIAIIAGHAWQHWLALFAGVFVHPELEVFEPTERVQAEGWLREPLKKAS
jgi:hypothetical protein